MRISFNSVPMNVQNIQKNIAIVLKHNVEENFTEYVDKLYAKLTDIRTKTRTYIQDVFLKRNDGGNLPNMFTNKYHGNDIRHNMLFHIIYDIKQISKKVNKKELKATIKVPYGIDTNGKTTLVKNKKGVSYARILNSGGKNNQFYKYKNFIVDIREEYARYFLDKVETFGKRDGYVQRTYRY